MSMAALLIAVQDHLRSELVLNSSQCRVMPDEKAIPTAGEEFISIYGAAWSPGDADMDYGIDEYYDVDCTITHRIRYVPQDRWGSDVYVQATRGLEVRARQVIGALHKSYKVVALANAMINTKDEIFEPLRWAGVSANPHLVSNDHYNGPIEENDGPVGMAMTVSFKDARRIQTIASFDSL